MPRRMTVPAFAALKGERRLVCLTAYDVLTAAALDEAGVDLLLVGDSMGNVVLGHETTLPVTLDEMVSHAAAVMRARPRALVVGDMPYLTFHVTPEETLKNAARFVREAGVDAVKLEGGIVRVPHIRKLVESEIPVMGHLGLTPQSVLGLGGYRVQARSRPAAEHLLEEAKALEAAGCFSLVLESVPAPVAAEVTRALSIPTIGIGAGPATDGQVLVITDLLGLAPAVPRFVRRYADMRGTVMDAVRRYAEDVREGRFPGPEETYPE
jgi:3-methyl-2-oxobutanoate hydroxymethyltransferase